MLVHRFHGLRRLGDVGLLLILVDEDGSPELDHVTRIEPMLVDKRAVDECSRLATGVKDDETSAAQADLGVNARDIRIVKNDGAIRRAPKRNYGGIERYLVGAVEQYRSFVQIEGRNLDAGKHAGWVSLRLRLDGQHHERARCQRFVGFQPDQGKRQGGLAAQ